MNLPGVITAGPRAYFGEFDWLEEIDDWSGGLGRLGGLGEVGGLGWLGGLGEVG